MRFIYRLLIGLFCVSYCVIWLSFNYTDARKILRGQFHAPDGSGDIFDQCILESGPLWTDQLREEIDPAHDPMKSCNRSYVPWSELLPDGKVQLTEACPENASCRARAVLLKSEYRINPGQWRKIDEEVVFENDIVEVECKVNDVTVYNFLHHQIWRDKGKNKKARKAPSVYIIVLDSIGASHGRRVFNQTHTFLKKEFGAVEMKHMNKVGENSRPNGIALLFGKLINEIKRDMYGLPSRPPDWSYDEYCKSYLDDKGFILKQFEKAGYVTMMAEDWVKGVFNWPSCKAFEKQPTTHYMRPFQLRSESGGKSLRNTMSSEHCYEPHLFLNEYLEKFIKAYPDSPKASMTWAVALGHDSLDKPFHTDIQYKQLFERNKEEFDNSFIFFMGDHGMRFNWYPQTPIGERDINNPMLIMSIPRWLRSDTALMANLERNSGQLLTMFDTHATFVDIVETFARKISTNFHEAVDKPELLGSSLLRPLPHQPRNCKKLPIPPQYCICDNAKEQVNVTAQHAPIGQAVAKFVNEQLAKAKVSRICAELELNELLELERIIGADELYEVTLQLRPGVGIFHTFVQRVGGNFSVIVPDVPRYNYYRSAGDCTNIYELRSWCYCKSNLKNKH